MGLIGGNSYGFAYARARDGVEVEELEAALLAEVDALLRDGLPRSNFAAERLSTSATGCTSWPGSIRERMPSASMRPCWAIRT